MATFKTEYLERIRPKLQKQFGFTSVMEVPRLVKITLNMGLGEAVADKKIVTHAMDDMMRISGQKPVSTLSRQSIAGFKIREDWPIGCKVTLRRDRMFEFFERLIVISIPRIRDFRGFTVRSFDGRGNYSLGIREQIVFPEIEYDKIDVLRGLDVTLTTTAKNNKEGAALLAAFGFPFKDFEAEA